MNADSESGKWMGTDLLGCSCHLTHRDFLSRFHQFWVVRAGPSIYRPCLPPTTLLCMREKTEFFKAGLATFLKEPDRWAEADSNCIFFHSALRYSSWSGEPVVSEDYFVSALKSLQVGMFSPRNQIWRNVRTKAAFCSFILGSCVSLSLPFSITTTPRESPMPGLLHHTSCWRMRGQGPKREVSLGKENCFCLRKQS